MKLLERRLDCRETEIIHGDSEWVFPSLTSKSGHVEELKLTREESKLFRERWSPHTLRH